MKKNILLVLCFLALVSLLKAQSFFAEGEWIKLGVTEGGFCKLTKSQLTSYGLTEVDSKKLKVYGGDGRDLIQKNADTRYLEPQLVPHLIIDTGKYSTDFALVFLAESPSSISLDPSRILRTNLNTYSDTVYYYITKSQEIASQINTLNSTGNHVKNENVIIHGHYEKDEINFFESGRTWVSDKFNSNDSINTFEFSLQKVNSPILFSYNLVSWSSINTTFFDLMVGERDSLLTNVRISRSNSGYGVKLRNSNGTVLIDQGLVENSILKLKLDYDFVGDNNATGYVDFFDWQYETLFSDLQLNQESHTILSEEGTFCRVKGQEDFLWTQKSDNPFDQKIIFPILRNDSLCYDINSDPINLRLFSLEADHFISPVSHKVLNNFNLSLKKTNPKLLIIYHPLFEDEVLDFQMYKEGKGITTEIANINQIVDVFGSGKKDVSAVRNYIKKVYESSNDLKYVLLFGDCSYDYKDRIPSNTNYIPVYQSIESYHNVQTHSSDDFYGFMESEEGEWVENSNGNHSLDLAIGRFPVSKKEEAEIIINKVKEFDKSLAVDSWKTKVLFVADDKDDTLHVGQANELMAQVRKLAPHMLLSNVFLDAYSRPQGSIEVAKEDFLNKLNDGAMFVNFTGHGTEYVWMEEQLLTIQDIKKLNNVGKNSIFITATCEFGRYDNPSVHSGAEELIFAQNGAISLITTTRPVYSSSNFEINKSFYNTLFTSDNITNKSIGEIFQITKNNSLNGVFNRNFSLLGDPSLMLSFPTQSIRIDSINHIDASFFSDTLNPTDEIQLKGVVLNGGTIDVNFNGIVEVLLFDNSEIKSTKGYEGQRTALYQSDPLLIVKVFGIVKDGRFDFQFALPYTISASYGLSQLQLYATDLDRQFQAIGTYNNMVLGGDFVNKINNEPQIFVDKPKEEIDSVFSTSLFLDVNFKDDYGILLNKDNIGKETQMVINEDYNHPIFLNDSLVMKENSSKWVTARLHLQNLKRGSNKVEFQTWDIHGLGAKKSFEIYTGFAILLSLYPNPISDKINLQIKNTLIEETYEIDLHVYNQLGEEISSNKQLVEAQEIDYEIHFTNEELNLIQSGIYFYTIDMRFTSTNDIHSVKGKIIKL